MSTTTTSSTPRRGISILWFVLSLGGGLVLIVAGSLLIRFEMTVEATGMVAKDREWTVFSTQEGVVVDVFADEGGAVSEGVALLQLDTRQWDWELFETRERLARLEARLRALDLEEKRLEIEPVPLEHLLADDRIPILEELARLNDETAQRMEDLRASGSITLFNYKREKEAALRTRLELAEARLLVKQRQMGLAGVRHEEIRNERAAIAVEQSLLSERQGWIEAVVADHRVTTPLGGVLTDFPARFIGMRVERGQAVARVADTGSSDIVEARVPQRNADLIRPGTRVRMESKVFSSILEGDVIGEVVEIAPEADAGAGEPMIEVEVRVIRSPFPLLLGTQMQVIFELGRRPIWELLVPGRAGKSDPRADLRADGGGDARETDRSGAAITGVPVATGEVGR